MKTLLTLVLMLAGLSAYAQRMSAEQLRIEVVKSDTLNLKTTFTDANGKFQEKEIPTLCTLYRNSKGEEHWIYSVLATYAREQNISEANVVKRVPPKAHN